MKKNRLNRAVAFTLLVIAAGSGLLDYVTPMMGDDLVFWNHLGLYDYRVPDRSTLSFILAHIFGCNGRLFDYMGPIITNLPQRWVSSILMGIMSGVFFFSLLFAAKIPRNKHVTFSLGMLAIALAVLPWWDSMFLRVCQFNYLWASAFCLLFIGCFFREWHAPERGLRVWGPALLGICAGASHEQAGVAMCVAFGVWCLTGKRYRSLSVRRKYMLGGLLFGTMLSTCAPSIWARAATSTQGQTPGLLIATTLPALIALAAVCAVLLTSSGGRLYLKRRMGGTWGVLAVCAVVSGAIAVASGIPGRTGFLPESCAIAAFAMMALDLHGIKIRRALAAAASSVFVLFIAAHFAVSIAEQRKLTGEFYDVLEAYIASSDGIVYYDFTTRYDVAPLTLNRVKGVPDADDYWTLHSINEAYGTPGKKPTVIPTYFNGRIETLTDSISHAGTTIYTTQPAGCVVTEDDVWLRNYPGDAPQAVTVTHMADGREIWITTPRVRDPGDYELPVKTRL